MGPTQQNVAEQQTPFGQIVRAARARKDRVGTADGINIAFLKQTKHVFIAMKCHSKVALGIPAFGHTRLWGKTLRSWSAPFPPGCMMGPLGGRTTFFSDERISKAGEGLLYAKRRAPWQLVGVQD